MNMDYGSTLKALRSKMIERSTGMAAPQERSLESFIPARMQEQQPPQESTDDIITRNAEWVSDIKKAATELRKAYETASKGRERSPSAGASFVQGFQQGAKETNERKAVDPIVQAENREAFVSRRGEASPSSYAPTRPSEIKTFKDAIDMTEGGGDYNALFGYSNRAGEYFEGFNVSDMTIGEIKAFSDPKGEYGQWVKNKIGRVATPMGRYQFVGTTLRAVADEMGLDDNVVFTPEVQDAMFEHYLRKRIAKGNTMEEKVSQVRQAWEGFKKVPTSTLQTLIAEYEAI